MSTIKAINIQHPSAANAAITLDANSGLTFSGNLTLSNATISNTITFANTVTFTGNVSTTGARRLAGGFEIVAFNAGSNVAAYTTWTPNVVNGSYQTANSNGAFTIAAPSQDCAIDVLFSNGLGLAGNGAGSVTFSGYKVQSSGTGDAYTTAANNQYILSIRRINSIATYVWKALQ